MKNFLILAAFLLIPLLLAPTVQAQKRVYIANDNHTDYMWNGNEATYQNAFLQMLDYYVDQADRTAGEAPEFRGKFSADGSFWLYVYEQKRTSAQFDKLISKMRDGYITIPLNPLIEVYGGQPTEAIIRGMYYAGKIERRYNLRFPLAVAIENQVVPFGLGTIWAGAGAKYSWHGICACATKVSDVQTVRPQEIYWWQGLDGSKILMKWYNFNGNESLGGYAEARNPSNAIDNLTSKAGSTRYPYDVAAAFGKGWDDLVTTTDEFITAAKNKSNSSRKVYVSNEVDFFKDFEATYGSSLPSYSVTFGNEWELLTASLAEVTASVKRSVEKLRTAEGILAVINLVEPSYQPSIYGSRTQVYMDMGLYFEHDWTADGSVPRNDRLAWQRKIAKAINDYVNSLTSEVKTKLGQLITKTGSATRFYAYNPLSWVRDEVADIEYSGSTPVHIVDLTTNTEIPSQIVTIGGKQYLRILAKQVPSLGYKVFEIQPGAGQSFPTAASVSDSTIENDQYRLTVNGGGAITSLIAKQLSNKELVRNISGKTMNDLGSSAGNISVVNSGPVSVTIRTTSSSPLQHSSEITLYRSIDRIDINNEVTQNFGATTTWAYGFNLTNHTIRHEELGAIITAKVLANGGQYAPDHSRHDWQTLNHFVAITDSTASITLANADAAFMKIGNSSGKNIDTQTPQISVLLGGQIDGSSLGFPNQGGDSYFQQRFALQASSSYDQAGSMRFALAQQNPLSTGMVNSTSTSYPEKSYSLAEISNPQVLAWAVKPAEEGIGSGLIMRLWNLSDQSQSFNLTLNGRKIDSAKQTTSIETDITSLTPTSGNLSRQLNRQQMATYRLMTSSGGSQCPADIDLNGFVDLSDYSILAVNFFQTQPTNARADINRDGLVDIDDYSLLASKFFQSCS